MTGETDYYNVSRMDEDPFGEEELPGYDSNYAVYLSVVISIRLILYIIIVSADIFLMCVICWFKQLRVRANVYIFNCFLLHACLYLKSPLLFILFYLTLDVPISYYCMDLQSHTTVLSLYFLFAFILAVDWLLSAIKLDGLKFYVKYYIGFILGLYFLCGVEWGVSTALCMNRIPYFLSYITQTHARTIFYVVIVIGLIIVNVIKKYVRLNRDSLKTDYALTVANIIVFSYIPMLIHYLITNLFVLHRLLEYIMMYTEVIPEFLALANPIYVIYILGRRKYFKMAYARSFRRSLKTYNTDSLSEDTDEHVESVIPNVGIESTENVVNQDTTAILVL